MAATNTWGGCVPDPRRPPAGAEIVCLGPVDRVLALAQLTLGNRDAATSLLTSAHRAAEHAGAEPLLRRIQALNVEGHAHATDIA